jgi:L-threonylcarbamoyladenylate synthase
MSDPLYKALSLLSQGELVIVPTETVYGLFADATNSSAVQKIYELKNRPCFNPLILHVSSLEMAKEYAYVSQKAEACLHHFWHNLKKPLTFVLKRTESLLSDIATAGLDTVAVRLPLHEVPNRLINLYKRPLVAPSANPSMSISATSKEMVCQFFGEKTPFVLDLDHSNNALNMISCVGVESTIIDLSEDEESPALLRSGGCEIELIESFFKKALRRENASLIRAPGMLKRHYAPKKPLRINVNPQDVRDFEFFISFGPSFAFLNNTLSLSESSNVTEAARNLFRTLFEADLDPFTKGIAIAKIPIEGLGVAINDRIWRASQSL